MAARKTIKVATEGAALCKECRFVLYKRGDGMYCRRFPPSLVYDPATGASAPQNPEVSADGWCGEYQPQLNS